MLEQCQIDKIIELFIKDYKTPKEIAKEIGRSSASCIKYLKNAGVFKRRRLVDLQQGIENWTCIKCNLNKSIKDFRRNKGKNASEICKECLNKRHRELRALNPEKEKVSIKKLKDRVRKIVNEFKNSPCVDCGQIYEFYCMEFDHLNNKTLSVSAMITRHWKIERIKEEIAKCEVVCVLCHRLRTIKYRKQHVKDRISIRPKTIKQQKLREELRKFVDSVKASVACVDCNRSFDPCQMDFDHRPGTEKKASVSNFAALGSKKNVEIEMAKCDLVCVLCHRKRTHNRNEYGTRKSRGEFDVREVKRKKSEEISKRNDRIVELYKTMNLTEVGEKIGISGFAVGQILRKRNVTIKGISEVKRSLTLEEDKQIADLYKYGFSASEIVKMYNSNEGAVYSSLERQKVPRRQKARAIVDSNGVVYLSQNDASRKTGIPRPTISSNILGRLKHAGGIRFKRLEDNL